MIVIVHIAVLVPGQGGTDREFPLFLQIACLGMMLFFIISGHFYRLGRSPEQNIRKRVIQLRIQHLSLRDREHLRQARKSPCELCVSAQ